MPYEKTRSRPKTPRRSLARSQRLFDTFTIDLWNADADDPTFDDPEPGWREAAARLPSIAWWSGGVRGKGIPYPVLRKIFQQVGEAR